MVEQTKKSQISSNRKSWEKDVTLLQPADLCSTVTPRHYTSPKVKHNEALQKHSAEYSEGT